MDERGPLDEQAIHDRAQVIEHPAELLPNLSADEGPRWLAEDPETGCRGVGEFEHEARTNLVFAVRAYRNDPESEVGYFSSGRGQTYRMRWLDDGLLDRLRDALPF